MECFRLLTSNKYILSICGDGVHTHHNLGIYLWSEMAVAVIRDTS